DGVGGERMRSTSQSASACWAGLIAILAVAGCGRSEPIGPSGSIPGCTGGACDMATSCVGSCIGMGPACNPACAPDEICVEGTCQRGKPPPPGCPPCPAGSSCTDPNVGCVAFSCDQPGALPCPTGSHCRMRSCVPDMMQGCGGGAPCPM